MPAPHVPCPSARGKGIAPARPCGTSASFMLHQTLSHQSVQIVLPLRVPTWRFIQLLGLPGGWHPGSAADRWTPFRQMLRDFRPLAWCREVLMVADAASADHRAAHLGPVGLSLPCHTLKSWPRHAPQSPGVAPAPWAVPTPLGAYAHHPTPTPLLGLYQTRAAAPSGDGSKALGALVRSTSVVQLTRVHARKYALTS